MRHKSRWPALVLVLVVLAACGDGATDATDTPPGTDAPGTTEAPDDTDAPETTEAPGATDPAPGDVQTDVGVDSEAMTITVGLLSDLTGPFGPLVTAIVDGHQLYWDDVNANGGVNGYSVNLEVRDTAYVVENHVALYEEIRESVVALGHSTGSPHTVAIAPQLAEDGVLAVPLTWYSGWTDPAYSANVVHHGAPYCVESMNGLGYVVDAWREENAGAEPTVALASLPGDYGEDGAIGYKLAAEALGVEVVYDGQAQVIPGQDQTPIADAIVGSGADIVAVTLTPGDFGAVYGAAVASGYEARWTGNGPTWNPALVVPDQQIREAVARDFIGTTYLQFWSGESEGLAQVKALAEAAGLPPHDYYAEGFIEAGILHEALSIAFENGDATRAGVLAAAKSIESVEFGGMAPAETYVGEPNEQLQRQSYVFAPDLADVEEGGTGTAILEEMYTHPIAEEYVFESACYALGG